MSRILVIAESGFGKSTSIGAAPDLGIKGLDSNRTFIINISVNKELPFRGWKKQYIHVPLNAEPSTGNYFESNSAEKIVKTIKYIIEKRQDEFDTLVIDDLQYLMGDYYMDNGKKGGYDVFKEIGYFMGNLFKAIQQWKGNVICLTHPEEITNNFVTTYKAKTVGKMVDQYISMEGKFDIVLYGKQSFNQTSKKATKEFVTNFDGQYPAKSPYGMFNSTYIPNDLSYVLDQVKKYYEGE